MWAHREIYAVARVVVRHGRRLRQSGAVGQHAAAVVVVGGPEAAAERSSAIILLRFCIIVVSFYNISVMFVSFCIIFIWHGCWVT